MANHSVMHSTARLDRVAQQVPAATVDATTRLLQAVARHEEGAAFVNEILNVLAHVTASAANLQQNDAGSEYDAIVRFLEQPEVLDALRPQDPLLPARLRGLRMREQLLAAEGGSCTTKELAEALGVTRQAIDKRRRSGTLIGLSLGKRGYVYPTWQIDLDGLAEVLSELQEYDAWTQLAFMLTPNSWLEHESPLDVLRAGEIARAVAAAQLYGEQVAA